MDTLLDPTARASALLPALKERAARAEQLRRIPSDSVRDLLASGLIRIGIPDRFGGCGFDIDATFAVSMELGRGCGSTAWCYSTWSAHNWFLGYFPERCQEEHFAAGTDVLVASALNPANGRAEPVPGGYRVSGRWTFSSGCDAADWVIVGCGARAEDRRWLLLPRAGYDIVDTWFAVGLRGTGSKDVVARDVFVPGYRTVDPNRTGDDDRTGWDLHERASYRVPLKMLTDWALAAPIIGMAQGVVDEFLAQARGGDRGAAPVARQLRLAEAAAEVDTARTLHRAEVRAILDSSGESRWFTPLERARSTRNASFCAKLCLRAANRLYEAGGARAIMETGPVQRLHRDVNAACHHAALDWDAAAGKFARSSLAGD